MDTKEQAVRGRSRKRAVRKDTLRQATFAQLRPIANKHGLNFGMFIRIGQANVGPTKNALVVEYFLIGRASSVPGKRSGSGTGAGRWTGPTSGWSPPCPARVQTARMPMIWSACRAWTRPACGRISTLPARQG